MGLLARLSRIVRGTRKREARRRRLERDGLLRCRFETMEPRVLLDADPLQIGAVYLEEDLGTDVRGDAFHLTFEGGVAGTELTRIVIDGDQDNPGFGRGDVFFDTESTGFGADNAIPFTVTAFSDRSVQPIANVRVEDGTSRLIIDFNGFQTGDRLEFGIDVDEVEDFDPQETDPTLINDGFDPITSGVEFQSSLLTAYFSAPHYYDVSGTAEFRNRYDDQFEGRGLDLPADNEGEKRDRTAGAALSLVQDPLPVSIAGTVYLETDLDLIQDAGEPGIERVELALWKKGTTEYEFTGHTAVTDADGRYEFGVDLDLKPGTYQVRESQPPGLFSVGAIPGSVAGTAVGSVLPGDPNLLTEVTIPWGDEHAVDYDFAEALPARISGFVYHDRSNDGSRDGGEEGISGVEVQMVPVAIIGQQDRVSVTTDGQGFYEATGLAPGSYRVTEVRQPAGFFDGLDAAGIVDGTTVGAAANPGDRIEDVFLGGGQAGVEYNFGEIAPASLRGHVVLSDAEGNCFGPGTEHQPLENVTVQLLDAQGVKVGETTSNGQGEYAFLDLLPGSYTLAETTPSGLIDGGERVGTIDGVPVGLIVRDDVVGSIVIGSGQQGTDYDFCEHPPASLAGFVYHDENNNAAFDPDEEPIANVELTLLDAQGNTVATGRTDRRGAYSFTGLRAGEYSVLETHPAGWIDGRDDAGRVDGLTVGSAVQPGDRIDQVMLNWGDEGIHYDFGELLPVSLSGVVYHDRANDGVRDAMDEGIEGVRVEIIPLSTMAPQAPVTVFTDVSGVYAVAGLAPGTYRVVESQPAGFVDGTDVVGTVGGIPEGTVMNPGDTIDRIPLESGQSGIQYNFGEFQLASIEGSVYTSEDRGPCFAPGTVHEPLPEVVVTLQDAKGMVIAQTRTNALGRYAFRDLLPGSYTVVEQTPTHLIDGGERVGTVGGVPTGTVRSDDVIGGIELASGQQGLGYDFCEQPPAMISGQVYHDENGNGRRDEREAPIAGVEIVLRDAAGQRVAVARTDDGGRYSFAGLYAGDYSLEENHPVGWLDGLDAAGTVDGVTVGAAENPGDVISRIALGWGDTGLNYDFGELRAGSLSGLVHLDPNQNCELDDGEPLLEGVDIELLDANGQVLLTTRTGADGRYSFDNLAPGVYAVREQQPAGYFQGGQRAGSHGGDPSQADRIQAIPVGSGQRLVNYDFCELPPSSIAGVVYVDLNNNSIQEPGERGLSGVRMELMNEEVVVVATTYTRSDGSYRFDALRPDVYTVRETQPEGYFQGGQRPGGPNGDARVDDLISRIKILPGQHLVHYDFSEIPPAGLSGYVFQDGPTLTTFDGQVPDDLTEIRDGQRTADDTPLAGVVLELRNGFDGEPLNANAFLPGFYTNGTPRAVTDENGYYEFTELRGGGPYNYAVYQVQPDGFVDGIDTPGSTSGMAFNVGDPVSQIFISHFTKNPNHDAIVRIPLTAGQMSVENNFSEVRVERMIPWIDPPLSLPLDPVPDPPLIVAPPTFLNVVPPPVVRGLPDIGGQGTANPSPSWHLSVIDAGLPRDLRTNTGHDPTVWVMTTFLEKTDWRAERLQGGRWTVLGSLSEDAERRQIDFGIPGATPVVGDFNGDGLHEFGVYYRGEWFLDLNGNGQWDAEDLWAQLGSDVDLPVVGDWDGDGKDDIGIFGPEWTGDPRAIRVDPGLPDVANRPHGKPKNLPPEPSEATDGRRLLRLKAQGPRRTDLIDHVFRFGEDADYPVSGDWNGDGIRTVGIFRDGRWHLDLDGDGRLTERDATLQFGQKGDLPIAGDFNGDGIDEIGVYRRGMWYLDANGNRELDARDKVFAMGGADGIPVVGDWNGDGIDEPGVYRDVDYPTSTPAD
ncbi:MAG: SdrD B-like domain-containing protein [Pirellulaceae bacterium]